MQTLKYAFRNVTRSKGRSILIGIIVMIIAFAVCISLCIRQSAVDSKEEALESMNITAQISPDREQAMEKAKGNQGDFDKSSLKENMGSSLSLKQLKKYAKAKSVKSFYYTMTASVDGSGKLDPYTTSDSTSGSQNQMGGMMESQGEFTVTGYSSDEAMTSFTDGTCSIESGSMFDEGTDDMVCVISDELAEYDDLEVGDTITVKSTSDSSEKYKLKIVGIYTNSQSSQQSAMGGGPGMMGSSDPANQIYTSYNTLNKIVKDADSITGMTSGTYVVGTEAAYESFQEEVKEMGLSDKYTVSSEDITSYERMAEPLESLAKFAGYFLIVVLVVGAIILIVLNIFATRERKYEIGVLAAIGMKKKRIAALFMCEIMIITMAGIVIGGGLGAVTSVPVTKGLLSVTSSSTQTQDNFGRGHGGGDMTPPDQNGSPDQSSSQDQVTQDDSSSQSDSTSDSKMQGDAPDKGNPIGNYMTDISNAVNIGVLIKLLISCLAMSIVSGLVSVIAIMRYEPLEILSGRD